MMMVAIPLLFAVLTTALAPESQSAAADAVRAKQIARGKQVYAAQKCAACHSIEGTGNRRNPLDGVGSKLAEADVRQWIVAPRKMKATVRKPDYSKVAREDVDALAAYMMSLPAKR
jgi:mono/diheme cytochrome c family protein